MRKSIGKRIYSCLAALGGLSVLSVLWTADLSAQALGLQSIATHTVALHADGTVYTWGDNEFGKLGDGTTEDYSTPVQVLKGDYYSGTTYLGDDADNKIIAVAGGRDHSIALAQDGTVYAWGDNQYGQLGDSTTTSKSTPVRVVNGAYDGAAYLGDDADNKIIAVAGGDYHSMALAQDGTVYTWGYNAFRQLGDSTTTSKSTPVQVLKGAYSGTTYLGDTSSNKITAIVGGYLHSIALAEDGTVYAWGTNSSGLGDGTTASSYIPVRVAKGAYDGAAYLGDDASNKITAVAGGFKHSIALAQDGTVYTWGDNQYGQLGDSTTTSKSTPVRVLEGAYSGTTYLGDDADNKITAVAGGYFHSIALAQDGTVYTWGYNVDGALGDNTTTDRSIPVKVKGVGGSGDLSLPVGLSAFTATAEDGQVTLCWTTQSELDNLGFYVYRALAPDGVYQRITPDLIQGAGTTPIKHVYTFTDPNVVKGMTYWYQLESVAFDGSLEIHGPIAVRVEVDPPTLPTRCALWQNYPNPFNPVTRITYDLPEASNVTLTIYTMTGQNMTTLVSRHQEEGHYEVIWNGNGCANDVYLYRLEAGSFVGTKRMTLLK